MRCTQIAVAAALSLAAATAAQATVVLANDATNGDDFTNAGGSNMGQAVGATGWYYNNVRNSGVVGIDDDYARSGNGSVTMGGPNNAKADIEFLVSAVAFGGNYFSTGTLGSLSQLNSMSYDWYRDSSSTATSHLHAALRVLIDRDGDLGTTNDRGGLVFERVYNGGGVAATDAWITDTVTGTTVVWNFGLGLGTGYDIGGNGYAYDDTLAQWKAFMPNAAILGFSAGIGSGWAPYLGAVDNIGWSIGTLPAANYNFELDRQVQVPIPSTLVLALAALAALRLRRR